MGACAAKFDSEYSTGLIARSPESGSVQYQEGTAGKAVRYPEGTARTSGETNFSGVHKDSLAACGPGARVLTSPSPTGAQKSRASGAPARQLARFSLAKIKIIQKLLRRN